ncbi:MAG: SIMPL domain-containing protein [Minisyncoccia bacterium]
MDINNHVHSWKFWAIIALIVFAVASFGRNDGRGNDGTKTIAVQGTGDVYVIQDTVELSFTVTKKASDVKKAQADMNDVTAQIIKAVKGLGVEDKNIKTTSYSVYPHYSQEVMPCPVGSYCPTSSKVDGFEASQTVEVKMHDLAKSGDLVAEIGKFNPTNISGLSFVVEDDKAVLREARQKAIEDAKTKAKQLAKDLGVRLGDVVSFDESGRNYPVPVYMKAGAVVGMGGDMMSESAPSIPAGQNKITSNVTIVYEIK